MGMRAEAGLLQERAIEGDVQLTGGGRRSVTINAAEPEKKGCGCGATGGLDVSALIAVAGLVRTLRRRKA